MIRFFEPQDKEEIFRLSSEFRNGKVDEEYFNNRFEDIISGSQYECGIAILHAGEYLGYCMAHTDEKSVMIDELYVKSAFQKLKVAPQVFDFIEENFPNHRYQAFVSRNNEIANKVFKKRGYDIIVL